MALASTATRSEHETRPAFDVFEGFAITSVLASLEMAGLLARLEAESSDPTESPPIDLTAAVSGVDAALLTAALEYLARRGVVRSNGGGFMLTEAGRAICRDKGYLVWIAGGYAEPLRHLDSFLRGGARYGIDAVRDGRWVAKGAAILGARDVAPWAMQLLERIRFERVLDLGCGDARFLASVCQTFGCAGVGVDISPEACAEARKTVRAASLGERVEIIEADAQDLDAVPQLADTDLVITFFLLHEISSVSRAALVGFLSRLASVLSPGAHFLIAEVVPPITLEPIGERFTPEFTFVHALMRQSLLPEDAWRRGLRDGGFSMEEVLEVPMPGGRLILARKADA